MCAPASSQCMFTDSTACAIRPYDQTPRELYPPADPETRQQTPQQAKRERKNKTGGSEATHPDNEQQPRGQRPTNPSKHAKPTQQQHQKQRRRKAKRKGKHRREGPTGASEAKPKQAKGSERRKKGSITKETHTPVCKQMLLCMYMLVGLSPKFGGLVSLRLPPCPRTCLGVRSQGVADPS